MSGVSQKICPNCLEDFSQWEDNDSEGVWSRDGKNYCSGECVIIAWRQQNDKLQRSQRL